MKNKVINISKECSFNVMVEGQKDVVHKKYPITADEAKRISDLAFRITLNYEYWDPKVGDVLSGFFLGIMPITEVGNERFPIALQLLIQVSSREIKSISVSPSLKKTMLRLDLKLHDIFAIKYDGGDDYDVWRD